MTRDFMHELNNCKKCGVTPTIKSKTNQYVHLQCGCKNDDDSDMLTCISTTIDWINYWNEENNTTASYNFISEIEDRETGEMVPYAEYAKSHKRSLEGVREALKFFVPRVCSFAYQVTDKEIIGFSCAIDKKDAPTKLIFEKPIPINPMPKVDDRVLPFDVVPWVLNAMKNKFGDKMYENG